MSELHELVNIIINKTNFDSYTLSYNKETETIIKTSYLQENKETIIRRL